MREREEAPQTENTDGTLKLLPDGYVKNFLVLNEAQWKLEFLEEQLFATFPKELRDAIKQGVRFTLAEAERSQFDEWALAEKEVGWNRHKLEALDKSLRIQEYALLHQLSPEPVESDWATLTRFGHSEPQKVPFTVPEVTAVADAFLSHQQLLHLAQQSSGAQRDYAKACQLFPHIFPDDPTQEPSRYVTVHRVIKAAQASAIQLGIYDRPGDGYIINDAAKRHLTVVRDLPSKLVRNGGKR